MKQITILKIVVDIGLTVMLLLLMTYELIGEAAHEWLGIGMFALFIIHHILNPQSLQFRAGNCLPVLSAQYPQAPNDPADMV